MSRRGAALIVFLIAAFLAVPVAAQTAWITFRSDEGQFSVLMPVQPSREEELIPSGPGAPGRTVVFAAVANREMYFAGWAEYAPSFRFDTQAQLKRDQDDFVKEVNGRLLSSKPIALGGAPGLEFTAEGPSGYVSRGRVFVIGSRPFGVFAVVPAGNAASSANAERFVNSFARRAKP